MSEKQALRKELSRADTSPEAALPQRYLSRHVVDDQTDATGSPLGLQLPFERIDDCVASRAGDGEDQAAADPIDTNRAVFVGVVTE